MSLVIEGITAQIGGGAPSLSGGLMTILGSALAGAGIGSLVPVVGTAAGAVIGFGVGVVLEIIGIKEAAKVAYEASEDFQIMQDILDRCTDASSRTSSAMDSLKMKLLTWMPRWLTMELLDNLRTISLISTKMQMHLHMNSSKWQ